jgi:hypothetical protein
MMKCNAGRFLLPALGLFLSQQLFAGGRPLAAPDPATALQVTTRTTGSISLSWTPGTGSGRIVVVRPATGASNVAPANGIDYTVTTSGSYTGPGNATTGTGNVVVYNGSASSLTVTGLGSNTTYVMTIYEYNGAGGSTEYSSGLGSGTLSTLVAEPSGQVSSAAFTFGGVQSSTSVKVDYPSATAAAIGANGYLLLYKEGNGVTLDAADLPVDGTAYATGASIGSATVGAFINSSSQAASTITGLSGTKHYTFFLLPYAGSATNSTYNYNTGGSIASRYVPSFSGSISSVGGEAVTISSLVNSSAITDVTQGVQVWQFTISEGADEDVLPVIIRSITINTSASNQFNFYNGIQAAALFVGSTPLSATLTIQSGSDALQFTNISNVTVPDNGSITLSLRISVKANVNGGASTGSNNKDGARFVFQVSNANVVADAASSQFSAFTAVTSAASGANIYSVAGTAMRFAQGPAGSTDPYVALSPALAVEVVDAGGNRDVDFASTVTLSSTVGIDGVIAATPVSGLATFTGLYFTGSGNTLLNASGGGFNASSAAVAVNSVAIAGVYTFNAAATCSAGAAFAPASVAPHLAFSNFSITGMSCNSNGNLSGATTAATILSTNTNWGAAPDVAKYMEFTVTPASGAVLSASAISFETLRTAAGATNYTLRSSLDAYVSDLGTGTVSTNQSAVSVSLPLAFSSLSAAVSFRLYPWGGSSSGNFRVDNLLLRGSVSTATVLPVRLLSFTGKRLQTGARLEWATATESGNAGFTIERSVDGRRYEPVATIPSAATGGNSNSVLHYGYDDPSLPAAGAWYRLRQTDLDGRQTLSASMRIGAKSAAGLVATVLSTSGDLRINIETTAPGRHLLQLYGADGRLLGERVVGINAGLQSVQWPMAGQGAGIYFLRVTATATSASTTVPFVLR